MGVIMPPIALMQKVAQSKRHSLKELLFQIKEVYMAMDILKQGRGIASLFLQIDEEEAFINAISDDVEDPATASLIWHSLLFLFHHCDESASN